MSILTFFLDQWIEILRDKETEDRLHRIRDTQNRNAKKERAQIEAVVRIGGGGR